MAEIMASALKHDLGELKGPLIAFGGALSNLQALEALLDAAASHGIPDDHLICTGDVIGYGADPEPCLKIMRQRDIATVMGNVEEALALDAGDCGCNFVAGSTCETLANDWYNYARARVSAESRVWIRALPRTIAFHLCEKQVLAVHGGVRQINRYVFASDRTAIDTEANTLDEPSAVIAGHAGIPFSRATDTSLWHNAGVLGLPANDGTPRIWYSLITAQNGGLHFEHRALEYDFTTAAARMRGAGLPEAYAQALETGLWPDTSILPERERLATGLALSPRAAFWS